MMFHAGDNNFIPAGEVAATEGGGHKVDALGGTPCEDNLMAMAGIDKLLHLTADSLVAVGGLGGQMVRPAVDVGVEVEVIVVQGIDDRERLLRGGRIVEVDERVAMHLPVKYRELLTYVVNVHGLLD